MRMPNFLVYVFVALALGLLVKVANKAFSSPQPRKPAASPLLQEAAEDKGVDVAAALETWLKHFDARKIDMRKQLNAPATPEQISRLERKTGMTLPEDLRALYLIANGQKDAFKVTYHEGQPNIIELPFAVAENGYVGYLFGNYEFFSTLEAEKEWENWRLIYSGSSQAERDDFDANVEVRPGDNVRKHYANLRWLPFARDGGGNAYAVDLDPAPGGRAGQVIVIGADEDLRRVLAPSIGELIVAAAKRGFGSDVTARDQRFYFNMED